MLKACGDCHRATNVMPSASLPGLPGVGGVVGQMREHQRSMEQMLQGLVVPSNRLWQEGAKGFATTPFHPKDLPVNTADRRRMVGIEDRLHQVARDAVDAPAGMARAAAYATLLEACSGCHRDHPRIWGPGRGGH
jgi:cytochrome c553